MQSIFFQLLQFIYLNLQIKLYSFLIVSSQNIFKEQNIINKAYKLKTEISKEIRVNPSGKIIFTILTRTAAVSQLEATKRHIV